MGYFKKKYIVLLVPILLFLAILIQFILTPKTFLNKDNSLYIMTYIELSLFSFAYSLMNCIPFLLRVIRTKNTKSYNEISLLLNLFTGFCILLNIIFGIINDAEEKKPIILLYLRWIPDVVANIISLSCAIYVCCYKWYNMKKHKNEEKVTYYHNFKTHLLITICCVVGFLAISLLIYFKIINKDDNKQRWLYILTSVSGAVGIFSTLLFCCKIIGTKYTRSISLFSKISLLCSLLFYCVLDWQTWNYSKLGGFYAMMNTNLVTIFCTIIFIYYKISSLIKEKGKYI